jgi:hypothetical protein
VTCYKRIRCDTKSADSAGALKLSSASDDTPTIHAGTWPGVTSDAAEGAPLLLPALASAYAVAAYGSRRVALAGLLVAMAGLGVQIAFDPLARTAEQLWAAAVFVLLVAAAWLVGLAV